ncbi:MAG: class I SAM-dependent methyltransferase [Planctomycetota bacterium]
MTAGRGARDKWSAPGSGARYVGPRFRTRRAALRDPALVERILDRDGARPSLRPVLDAPCGTGRLRGVFERRGMRYVGLDVSWPMLQEARRDAEAGLVMGFVDRMPFRDDSFDVVVCCRLLHHLHDAEEAGAVVRELVRVAHRMVIVSFWDAASLHAWRARVGLRRPEGLAGRSALPKRALKRMFDAAGAEIVGFHHSFRFVSQQAFAVALKRAPVAQKAALPEGLSEKLIDLSRKGAAGSLGQA